MVWKLFLWSSSLRKSYSICCKFWYGKILAIYGMTVLRVFGLSALADKSYGFLLGDQHLRFWWFFAQSYNLISLKNVPSGFLKKFSFYEILAKNGQFLPFLAIFSKKNQVFGHFLRNCTSDLSKTRSETGDNCFESSKGSVVSGKFLFWPFWPFLGQKYIACGDIIWFWAVFGHFLPNCWCFFVNFCYLS